MVAMNRRDQLLAASQPPFDETTNRSATLTPLSFDPTSSRSLLPGSMLRSPTRRPGRPERAVGASPASSRSASCPAARVRRHRGAAETTRSRACRQPRQGAARTVQSTTDGIITAVVAAARESVVTITANGVAHERLLAVPGADDAASARASS